MISCRNLFGYPTPKRGNKNLTPHPDAEELNQIDGFDEVQKRLGEFGYQGTRICNVACSGCGKRVLKLGMKIHQHELHSGSILGEVDADVVARMKEEAAM